MRIEGMIQPLPQMAQKRSEKSGDAASFASVLSAAQTEKAESKAAKTGNPLGLSDEEYRRFFESGWRYDAERVVYFPPKDASEEEQRDWYETVKDMSIAELNHFLSDIGIAVNGGEYDYEGLRKKINTLGYRGVLEQGLKWLKEVQHDSAAAGVDQDSLAILAKHIRLCETMIDAFIKRANEKNAARIV